MEIKNLKKITEFVQKEVLKMNEEKVKKVLDEVRPQLQAEGGDVKLVDITEDGVVKVKLQGACASCPMSTMTLSMSIEKALKDNVPGVKKVESV